MSDTTHSIRVVEINIAALKSTQAYHQRQAQIIEACIELQRRALSYLNESQTWYAKAFPKIEKNCLHRADIASRATLRLIALLEKTSRHHVSNAKITKAMHTTNRDN